MFNDSLATTLGTFDGDNFTASEVTAFGRAKNPAFYTGKPHVSGLGYNFLHRNYRADLNKWQTADPIGYPDGYNNYAYVNPPMTTFDKAGLASLGKNPGSSRPPTGVSSVGTSAGTGVTKPARVGVFVGVTATKKVTYPVTSCGSCGVRWAATPSFETKSEQFLWGRALGLSIPKTIKSSISTWQTTGITLTATCE